MVTFPETLDLAPFMAPNRTDFKTVRMPGGPLHAPYMDWAAPERPPDSPPMPYKLYGEAGPYVVC
jgi:ubiquitin carboxyl-terminal hydrolase 16/45